MLRKKKYTYYVVCTTEKENMFNLSGFIITSENKINNTNSLDSVREIIRKEAKCNLDDIVVLNWKKLKINKEKKIWIKNKLGFVQSTIH